MSESHVDALVVRADVMGHWIAYTWGTNDNSPWGPRSRDVIRSTIHRYYPC